MPSERALRIAGLVLALLGIGISAYIALSEADGGAPVCLPGSSGCEQVADSEYSELFGVNVAVLGIAGYALLAGASLLAGDPGRFTGLLGALAGFGFSAYLTYVELFVIDAVCPWCIASATAMTALLVVNLMRASRYLGADPDARPGSSG